MCQSVCWYIHQGIVGIKRLLDVSVSLLVYPSEDCCLQRLLDVSVSLSAGISIRGLLASKFC